MDPELDIVTARLQSSYEVASRRSLPEKLLTRFVIFMFGVQLGPLLVSKLRKALFAKNQEFLEIEKKHFHNSVDFEIAVRKMPNLERSTHRNWEIRIVLAYDCIYASWPFVTIRQLTNSEAETCQLRDTLVLFITPVRYWRRLDGKWSSGETHSLRFSNYHIDSETSTPQSNEEIIDTAWMYHTKNGERDFRYRDNFQIYKVRSYGIAIDIGNNSPWKIQVSERAIQRKLLDTFGVIVGHGVNYSEENNIHICKEKQFLEIIIKLSAKLATVDGSLGRDEITTFLQVFEIKSISVEELTEVFKNAGESSETEMQIAEKAKFVAGGNEEFLEYLVLSLLQVAVADGAANESESNFIKGVCEVFGFDEIRTSRLFATIGMKSGESKFGNDSIQDSIKSGNVTTFYLQVLGLRSGATIPEIKAAYRQLARKYHPDTLRSQNVPLSELKKSEDIFKIVNEAHRFLVGSS